MDISQRSSKARGFSYIIAATSFTHSGLLRVTFDLFLPVKTAPMILKKKYALVEKRYLRSSTVSKQKRECRRLMKSVLASNQSFYFRLSLLPKPVQFVRSSHPHSAFNSGVYVRDMPTNLIPLQGLDRLRVHMILRQSSFLPRCLCTIRAFILSSVLSRALNMSLFHLTNHGVLKSQ